jgi:hypothetical protein
LWHLPLWLTGSPSNPLALFPVFVISAVALAVLLTWLYNGTEGSLLLAVLLHATANLPITFLITPLGGRAMILPYACYTLLLIITAALVVVTNGAADLCSTHRKQFPNPSRAPSTSCPSPSKAFVLRPSGLRAVETPGSCRFDVHCPHPPAMRARSGSSLSTSGFMMSN